MTIKTNIKAGPFTNALYRVSHPSNHNETQVHARTQGGFTVKTGVKAGPRGDVTLKRGEI